MCVLVCGCLGDTPLPMMKFSPSSHLKLGEVKLLIRGTGTQTTWFSVYVNISLFKLKLAGQRFWNKSAGLGAGTIMGKKRGMKSKRKYGRWCHEELVRAELWGVLTRKHQHPPRTPRGPGIPAFPGSGNVSWTASQDKESWRKPPAFGDM